MGTTARVSESARPVRTTAHASFPSGVTDARLRSATSLTLALVAPPGGRLSRLRLGSPPSGWIRDLPVVLSSQHDRRTHWPLGRAWQTA